MRRSTLAVLLLVAAAGAALCLAWPRIHEVETGRTPEYPDLRPRAYTAGLGKVAAAVKAAVTALPRWRVVGAATGARGADVQAEHAIPLVGLKEDVTVRLRRQGGHTEVGVLSRSAWFRWDFGQNARNVRELLEELDRQMEAPPK